jgi:hypothetical protein
MIIIFLFKKMRLQRKMLQETNFSHSFEIKKQMHNPEQELFLLQKKYDGLPAFSLSALPAGDFNAERAGESETALHFFER